MAQARSSTNHAGIPAIEIASFNTNQQVPVAAVVSPGDGRRIRVHGYTLATSANGTVELTSSSTTTMAGTEITRIDLNGSGTSVANMDAGNIWSIGTCLANDHLCVSSANLITINGMIKYSLVP